MGEQQQQKTPLYRRVEDICVDLFTQQEQIEKRLINGRALLNTEKGEFLFAQNPPRGPRSVEIGRTEHSRFVRRPDGLYTITLRVDAGEKLYREQLIAEVRTIATRIAADYKTNKDLIQKKKKLVMSENLTKKKLLVLASILEYILFSIDEDRRDVEVRITDTPDGHYVLLRKGTLSLLFCRQEVLALISLVEYFKGREHGMTIIQDMKKYLEKIV